MSEQAIVALGSNIEPERHLPEAVAALRALGAKAVSSVYQNPARGGRPQPDFLNAAVLLETQLEPAALKAALRGLEADFGRVRTEDKYAPRTIDLDLLLLGDRSVMLEDLILPDPELLTKAHLAVPAAEVAPTAVHPHSGETLQAIAERLRPDADLHLRQDVTARALAALRAEGLA
ncbi:MAG TPA: 2-amino-4-hydroxy-6-hydroxymethyldihydropteridine diphosphokinase, partial [Anaerolineales bacterium]|nr:2-amino-4-hydroxy-6-hydroxymethyldihydropteridine diphosphokinase [Anaerolineales bacterium]